MDTFREEILLKLQTVRKSLLLKMIDEIKDDPARLRVWVDVALSDIPKISYHACWGLLYLSQRFPGIPEPYTDRIIDKLTNTSSDSQLATLLSVLYFTDFDTSKLSGSINFISHLLFHEKKQTFIKTYSLRLLYKIGDKLPEFREEIAEIMKLTSEFSDKSYLKKKAYDYCKRLSRKR
ncbi:MAG TPA: hypothetical protein P5050_04500 [Bacteroidia bacterium]|nr:hypothetical protein [Bacteroidia bacterium]HRS58461.1 hypothetical protein [Bacteroidia bacterium]HRU68581.1 hypothetical protein [Bacteroidia bacterium]